MFHLSIIMMMLNIAWSGYPKQKLIAVAIYFTFLASKVLLKILVPWNGEHPTNLFDLGMPIQAAKAIVFHPVFIVSSGVYLDDDIWEYLGFELEKGEKTD